MMALAVAQAQEAGGTLPDAMVKVLEEFMTYKNRLRDGLLPRVTDLKNHLDDAIDAVEKDLGSTQPAAARHRHFRQPQPLCRLSGNGAGGWHRFAVKHQNQNRNYRHQLA